MAGRAGEQLRLRDSATVVAAALVAPTAWAQQPYRVQIPAEPLAQALQALSRQTNVNILFQSRNMDGLRSTAVVMSGAPEDVARRLIGANPFEVIRDPTGTLIIRERMPRLVDGGDSPPPRPQAASPAPQPQGGEPAQANFLGEVIVTATRQTDTAGRVPLSITAVTQRTLDQEGVETTEDLARSIPSITFRRDSGAGNTNIFIRGITSAASNTAPTTGIYLDDTPLQKPNVSGLQAANGTPFPEIFDLDRIEVLRGPQGTLYGESSEGGTIRFITPLPNLNRYSVYARAQTSQTEDGSPSYEGGVAVSAPLVRDKVAMRVSLWSRHQGGYVDHVNLYTGQTMASDTNWADSRALRASILIAPTENLTINPAIYGASDYWADGDGYWNNVPQYRVNQVTFNNGEIYPRTVNGVTYSFPNTVYPGGVYGPYNSFGPYKTGLNYYSDTTGGGSAATTWRAAALFVPTLTIDYKTGAFRLKSITSYSSDYTKLQTSGQIGLRSAILPTGSSGTGDCGQGGAVLNYASGCTPLTIDGFPQLYQYFRTTNRRASWTQELRLSFNNPDAHVSWVAGAFVSADKLYVHQAQESDENDASIFLRGVPEAYFLGAEPLPGAGIAYRVITVHEDEEAVFGEANYFLTAKLKATLGLRFSRDQLNFFQTYGGSVAGAPPGYTGSPAAGILTDPSLQSPFPTDIGSCPTGPQCPLQYTQGAHVETPITPKIGFSYQIQDGDLVYVSIARGFRSGGVNPPVPPLQCASDLAALGTSITPSTYNSDSVWSYELGGKFRTGRFSLDSSLFYIDWDHPQINTTLRQCSFAYTTNAGHAISTGFDTQGQLRPFDGLLLSGSIAYTDAYFTTTVRSGSTVVINKGDELGAPRWQASLRAQYDFLQRFGLPFHLEADYQYSGRYQRTVGPGALGYDPITANGATTHFLTARFGVALQRWNLDAFVNNAANSQDQLNVSHTTAMPLVTASTFRPREIGLQATYHY